MMDWIPIFVAVVTALVAIGAVIERTRHSEKRCAGLTGEMEVAQEKLSATVAAVEVLASTVSTLDSAVEHVEKGVADNSQRAAKHSERLGGLQLDQERFWSTHWPALQAHLTRIEEKLDRMLGT